MGKGVKRFWGNSRVKAPEEEDIVRETVNEAQVCFDHHNVGFGPTYSRCKPCAAFRVQTRLWALGYWAKQRKGAIKTNAPRRILEKAIAMPKSPGIPIRNHTWDWEPIVKNAPKAKHVYLFEAIITVPVEIAADDALEAGEAWELYREGIKRVVTRDIGPMPRVHSRLREIDGTMLPQSTNGALV